MNSDVDLKHDRTSQPHRWKKGEPSPNPKGRPANPEAEELRQAIRLARKRHNGRGILVHFIERAYVNDAVLIALMKKVLPEGMHGIQIFNNVANSQAQTSVDIGLTGESADRQRRLLDYLRNSIK